MGLLQHSGDIVMETLTAVFLINLTWVGTLISLVHQCMGADRFFQSNAGWTYGFAWWVLLTWLSIPPFATWFIWGYVS